MIIKAGYVEVCSVEGELSAHMVKIRLESFGVPCMIMSETYFNLYLGFQAPFSILVPSGYAPEAKKLLKKRDFDMIYSIPKKRLLPYSLIRALSKIILGA